MSSTRPDDSAPDGVRRVPVSLRGGDVNRYFSEFEISTSNGEVEPIEYEGRRYVFSHRIAAYGYRAVAEQDLHVFAEQFGD